ncbi:formyltransferase family protein [Bradyrhizobium shewense]|uniref:formyltransferase family protein n=1 Tax=Bradyrhizobium shewense TaxID=1761772 RepID=UPI0013F6553F
MNDIARHGCLLVSVIWPWIFPAYILAQFDRGGINLHPAPLPEYRGSLGRTHATLNGDESFGVTVQYLSEQLDGGDIIGELRFPTV